MDRRDRPPSPPALARVLLVDDEDAVRRVTTAVLKRLGCSVVVAGSGTEGVRLARERAGEFDLLLSDLSMDDASGFEVAAAFRSHNEGRPVILMSGYSDEVTKRRVESSGAEFLAKPFDMEVLSNTVRNVLASRPGGGEKAP